MKSYCTIFIYFSLSIIFNINLHAQTTPGFNYQALVRDSEGKVAQNTNVQFRIGIVSGNIQGPTLYQETHQVTTDEYGQITLNIGNGSPIAGNFQNIDWADNSTFLIVELDIQGGSNFELLGTTQLLSVPYALYAYTTDDEDPDPTNELQNWNNLPGIPEHIDTDKTDDFSGQFSDLQNVPEGLIDGDDVDDADADPTNELQIIVSAQNGNLLTSGDDEGAFLGQSNLIPNLSSVERDALNSLSPGMLIFNTDQNCLNFYTPNGWRSLCGNTIIPPSGDANGMLGNTFTSFLNGSNEAFSQNPACGDRLISVSGCDEVNGATLIDDPNTTGVEYYLPQTSSGLSEDYALVEINGQCWFAENLQEDPTIYQNMPNLFTSVSDDNGWWYGFFGDDTGQSGPPSAPPANYDEREGFLYMWRAAMNGEAGERMQGACPTGWHIPSDCEWMYLEHGLGMSISNQLASGSGRTNGQVGMKLKDGGMSGFQGLYAGYVEDNSFNFLGRGNFGNFWTSTDQSGGIAVRRYIETNDMGVDRVYAGKAWAYSVRCLKD
jgi:uncharacterized protein (TIGR02145 family)